MRLGVVFALRVRRLTAQASLANIAGESRTVKWQEQGEDRHEGTRLYAWSRGGRIEDAPKAFLGLFCDGNLGKRVVCCAGAVSTTMRNLPDLFAALADSEFRSRFRLGSKESEYLSQKGLEVVVQHANKFIRERLAPRNHATTASRHRCEVIPCSSPSTPRRPAAGVAYPSGIGSTGTSR